MSIDEDYYKPIIANSAFKNNYIQYESKGNKEKTLATSEYLDMIRPYLSDIINDHEAQINHFILFLLICFSIFLT